jgi:hypothetical protein
MSKFGTSFPISTAGKLDTMKRPRIPPLSDFHFFLVLTISCSDLTISCYTLQIILDLCVPEKELAKTRSHISFTCLHILPGTT